MEDDPACPSAVHSNVAESTLKKRNRKVPTAVTTTFEGSKVAFSHADPCVL
jgi:hypothetical protein